MKKNKIRKDRNTFALALAIQKRNRTHADKKKKSKNNPPIYSE